MKKNHRREARGELWRQYWESFSYFWKTRRHLGGGVFRTEEAEFMSEALAIQERPVSKSARLVAATLMAIALFVLFWACLGKMDIVVNAKGKIIGSNYNKTIASVEVASVRVLHVREGQSVKAGDVLVELDSSGSDAEHLKAKGVVVEARMQMARGTAMIDAIRRQVPPRLPAMLDVPADQWRAAQQQLDVQYREFRSKLNRVDGEIVRHGQALQLAKQQAEDYSRLSKTNDVSVHAWQEKEQARIEIEGSLEDARKQRIALVEETRKETWDLFTEGRKLAAAYEQDAMRAGERSKLLKLVAPVDGTVQQLAVHTVGGVVPGAEPLMMIVPNEKNVEVEAFVENKDIGFVREGREAAVKIDAFNYSKYGTIPARIKHVSRDALQDQKLGLVYAVRVVLERATLEVEAGTVQLGAGLAVNVEIKTGERRIIEYFLSPLLQYKREALSER